MNSITQKLKEGNKLLKNIQQDKKKNDLKLLTKVAENGKESTNSFHSRLSKTSHLQNNSELPGMCKNP